jgi:hypothetical protein
MNHETVCRDIKIDFYNFMEMPSTAETANYTYLPAGIPLLTAPRVRSKRHTQVPILVVIEDDTKDLLLLAVQYNV